MQTAPHLFNHYALMHGRDYDGRDLAGWVAQEKFDGFRACWNGVELRSRQGEKFSAPDWFTAGLPESPVDAELFLGYGRRGALNGIVWNREAPLWHEARLMVFDAPLASGGILERLASIAHSCERVTVVDACPVRTDLNARLASLIAAGGEGFMLRDPAALYSSGRTDRLLKFKRVAKKPAPSLARA